VQTDSTSFNRGAERRLCDQDGVSPGLPNRPMKIVFVGATNVPLENASLVYGLGDELWRSNHTWTSLEETTPHKRKRDQNQASSSTRDSPAQDRSI
jgi:hypothetical protein